MTNSELASAINNTFGHFVTGVESAASYHLYANELAKSRTVQTLLKSTFYPASIGIAYIDGRITGNANLAYVTAGIQTIAVETAISYAAKRAALTAGVALLGLSAPAVLAVGVAFVTAQVVQLAYDNNVVGVKDLIDNPSGVTQQTIDNVNGFFAGLGERIGNAFDKAGQYLEELEISAEGFVTAVSAALVEEIEIFGDNIEPGLGADLVEQIASVDDEMEAMVANYELDPNHVATIEEIIPNAPYLVKQILAAGLGEVSDAFDAFRAWVKALFYSPLLVDLDGGGTKGGLVSAENGVFFDVDGDGFAERIGWTDDSNAIVVRDINSNGVIDSQIETFYTDNTHDAFAMLAEYDATVNGGNNDGKFTSLDGGWSEIQPWAGSKTQHVCSAKI